MIKTLRDFREALDKMMEERGYSTKGHVQADTGTDDILVSSSDPEGKNSIEVIFVPPRSGKKRG
jgi:hypothetical protein|tara:strand:+ start:16 stop:207 length:192 start_codon:yes stop_codon:yes gene_type:complete